MVEWLKRIFFAVPENWRPECIAALYRGKKEKKERTSHRGISLLSIPEEVYGRVIIERVMASTKT